MIEIDGVVEGKVITKNCSQLIMGSAGLYPDEMDKACELLDAYLNSGANTIDTARHYKGSEEVLGKWMDLKGNRADVQILSKCAHPDRRESGNRVRPDAIKKDLYESLETLNTDYIDFYALHRDDPDVDVTIIIDALNEHINDGKIHAIGVSNWSVERIQKANDYALANKLVGFSFNSPNLSLATCNEPRWTGCVSAEKGDLSWHKKTQMPLLSWSSQAAGFFSGKFTPDYVDNEEMVRVYYNSVNWQRYHRAELLAKEKGVSTIQIALAYVVNQSFPTAAIIGPETTEELGSSVEAANLNVTEEEMKWLTQPGEDENTFIL